MLHNRIFIPLLVVLAVVAASCGAGTQREAVTTGTQVSATDPGLASFRDAGCAACHGQNGQGNIGPPMGGHTAQQVVRQVRAPLGAMPLFSPDELSNAELASIVDFVVGLGPMSMDHGGADPEEEESGGLDQREVLIGHHWMTLSAINEGQTSKAIAHVTNITELVQGEHLSAMNEVVAMLEAGDLEGARVGTLEMLAGFLPEAGSIDTLHLQLASQALAADLPVEASVHLGRVGDGPLIDVAQLAVEALSAGDADRASEIVMAAIAEEEHSGDDDGH